MTEENVVIKNNETQMKEEKELREKKKQDCMILFVIYKFRLSVTMTHNSTF